MIIFILYYCYYQCYRVHVSLERFRGQSFSRHQCKRVDEHDRHILQARLSFCLREFFFSFRPWTQNSGQRDLASLRRIAMHRKAAVFALLQYIMAIFACDLKSEISRSQRSIIEVPTFFDDRFAQQQRHSVVGYDGQCRQIFEEAVDDGRCYSLKSRANFQLPAQPEKPRNIIYLHTAYSSIVTIVIILSSK